MDEYEAFERIKGYETEKKALRQLCDIMRHPEHYAGLGVSVPRGLLLVGEPGVGKTLMAKCLMEASGWNSIVCRKNKPDGEFINHIADCFEKALENQPCILLLDDMDKFANEDQNHADAEEYVTVQACVDEMKGKEVFVIATVNEEHKLPDSLLRSGRFDRRMEIEEPYGKEGMEIAKAFLNGRTSLEEPELEAVSALLAGCTCAQMETIVNEAGILAGYARREAVDMDDLILAFLMVTKYMGTALRGKDREDKLHVACHEAGHAVTAELLRPGSVSLVSLAGSRRTGGITCCFATGERIHDADKLKQEICIALAGKVATELQFGTLDPGAKSDIRQAYDMANILVAYLGAAGLDKVSISYDESMEQKRTVEQAEIAEVERCAAYVRKLLARERGFLRAVADALLEKETITRREMAALRENYSGMRPIQDIANMIL